MPDASHRFTEAEVRAIFEEAARRQAARQAADAPGLTLAELQAVATETGLDPDLVAAAAAHLPEDDAPAAKKYPLWDVPEEVRVERVIPGDISDELWERMVAELRRTFGQTGRAGQVGRVREWATEVTSGGKTPIHVEARPEGGQTRIVLTQSLKSYREASYVFSGMLLAMGLLLFPFLLMVATPEKVAGAMLLSALFAALGLAAGFGTRQTARSQHRKQTATFESVLDRLDLLALRAAPRVPSVPLATPEPAPAPLAEAPRQRLTVEPEAAPEDAPAPTRQRTRS